MEHAPVCFLEGEHNASSSVLAARQTLRQAPVSFFGGVIILTISGGYRSQKLGLFPFNPPLNGGDFDHGKRMKPVLVLFGEGCWVKLSGHPNLFLCGKIGASRCLLFDSLPSSWALVTAWTMAHKKCQVFFFFVAKSHPKTESWENCA